MTSPLGSSELRRAVLSALEGLRAHQDEIDAANVYPVPDGDTGTNLTLTMVGVAEALAGVDHEARVVAQAVVDGALNGARGNSGVILAQILRGLCGEVGLGGAGPKEVARGLRAASQLAYEAVLTPVEGTMLSVMRAAAEAVRDTDGKCVAEVLETAAEAARDALEKTPEQLPVLKAAGVLDAGGMGLCVVLEAFASALSGKAPPPPPVPGRPRSRPRETGSGEFAFEVQYLLEADDGKIAKLRSTLSSLGDSVVVAGGNGLWRVHVHTNRVDEVIGAARVAGDPRGVEVSTLIERVEPEVLPGTRAIPVAMSASPASVVAVVAGEGLKRLFRELGAAVVVDGGSTMNPSVGELARAVDEAPTSDIILLINNGNVIAAANQVAALTEKHVRVVATMDLAQGVVAMLAYSQSSDLARNVEEMRAGVAASRTARVVLAVRDAATPAGPVRAGQAMGLLGDEPAIVAENPVGVILPVLERMEQAAVKPSEAVTVLVGAGVPDEEVERVREEISASRPGASLEIHHGGQPVERYLLAVE